MTSSNEQNWICRASNLAPEIRNFVDGRWTQASGPRMEKRAPRDGKLLCEFSSSDAHDADNAVKASRNAFGDGRWAALPVQQRKDVLFRLACLVDQHREELALLECIDTGRPISDALAVDVPMTAAIIKFNAEAVDKFYAPVYAADRTSLSYQLRRPVGVVAGIVGWNFPLALAAGKLGPALAVGNSVILKPSELSSLATARLAELAVEAGLPPGVLNVIHGNIVAGAALANHRDIDLLSFTGSTATGKRLLVAAGESNMKKVILECGGKAPNIVFEDCPDLDAVAAAVIARAFWNQGQVCTASTRLLVQESVKENLLSLIKEKTHFYVPGDPLLAETRLGAVISADHARKIRGYVELGKREGGRVIYERECRVPIDGGFYVAPTVFDDVSPEHTIAREEIFGPVLSVLSFKDVDEAVALANKTIYGLSAIVWTTNMGLAQRVTHAVKAGWVVVNATATPTGGPGTGVLTVSGHKESGLGAEGGTEGMENYLSKTAVQMFV